MWQRLGHTLEERPEAVHVVVQTQKTDAELSLHVANAEARISASEHSEQKVSERELTRAVGEAAEETANVEVQQLENQEAAAHEIESHENVRSAALQDIEETGVSWTGQRLQLSKTRVRARQSMAFRWMELSVQRFLMGDMRRQFPERSAQLSSLRRDLHEIRCRSDGRSWGGPRTVSSNRPAAAGSVRKMQ